MHIIYIYIYIYIYDIIQRICEMIEISLNLINDFEFEP